LKIASNPFAKGFRDCDPEDCVSPQTISDAMCKMATSNHGNTNTSMSISNQNHNNRKTASTIESPNSKKINVNCPPKSSQEIKANSGVSGDTGSDGGNSGSSSAPTGESCSSNAAVSQREKSVKSKQN
jgi:hypothetical protein